MQLSFCKYQGTGNDFILIDNRTKKIGFGQAAINLLCDRKFGVGADGLILLEDHPDYDFEMVYFNADGNQSSMCGNGGRCITAFAKRIGLIEKSAHFLAVDGPHDSTVNDEFWVELKMSDVNKIEHHEDHFVLDTGSPHFVTFVEDIDDIDVVENGQAIRYSKRFKEEGINVNFVEKKAEGIQVATYERGVEDETLSCGTGVTAAALVYKLANKKNGNEVAVSSKGGQLSVRFEESSNGGFKNIWLCGPASFVFEGQISLEELDF